ncbi:MAG: hypothetical protein Q605_AUC00733G0003, partial [Actinomyces urogenitalis DORA_12]
PGLIQTGPDRRLLHHTIDTKDFTSGTRRAD